MGKRDDQTVEDLREEAERRRIDLKGATKRQEIIDRLDAGVSGDVEAATLTKPFEELPRARQERKDAKGGDLADDGDVDGAFDPTVEHAPRVGKPAPGVREVDKDDPGSEKATAQGAADRGELMPGNKAPEESE